ncbi:hypothetical protein ACH5RR_037498 [Cinchona calisaya]|uniref:Uncharacterized protein n=1 Tax=Cinchona calisaya TaxID=153742 RepID=A0ABD2YA16_9GENT
MEEDDETSVDTDGKDSTCTKEEDNTENWGQEEDVFLKKSKVDAVSTGDDEKSTKGEASLTKTIINSKPRQRKVPEQVDEEKEECIVLDVAF